MIKCGEQRNNFLQTFYAQVPVTTTYGEENTDIGHAISKYELGLMAAAEGLKFEGLYEDNQFDQTTKDRAASYSIVK